MGKTHEDYEQLLEDGAKKLGPGFNLSHDPGAPLHDTPDAERAWGFWYTASKMRARLSKAAGLTRAGIDRLSDREIVRRAGKQVELYNRQKDRPLLVEGIVKEIRDGLLLTASLNPLNARRAAQARLDQIQRLRAKAQALAPDLYGPDMRPADRLRHQFHAGVIKTIAGIAMNEIQEQADTIEALREKLGLAVGEGVSK